MAVMAPVSGLSLAALARFSAGLPLPEAAPSPDKQPRLPDVVVFSSAPMRVLSDLASAGLRQLAALLPLIEQAVQGESPAPLGHLAKAASAAARQIGDGHEALLAEGPDRVAASMQRPFPAQSAAPSVVGLDTKQGLRTLARQMGEDAKGLPADGPDQVSALSKRQLSTQSAAPPTVGVDTKQVLRTLARQVGDETEALPGEGPNRVAASLQRQLATQPAATPTAGSDTKEILRTLARQIGAEAELPHDGRASENLRTIARQLGTAGPSEPRAPEDPGAGPIQRWLSEAKHLLRSTSDALGRAEEQLRPTATQEPQAQSLDGTAQSAWVMTEILAAQAQVALAYAAVSQTRTGSPVGYRAVAPRRLSLDNLAGATTLLGMLLVVSTLWVLGGLWSAAAGIVACCGAAAWVWRISRASQGVTLDVRP